MANLLARASAGFTTASTWGISEVGAGAEQLTRSSGANTTTSYAYAAASFTVTVSDSIEGLLLRCKRLNSTGTVTVTLSPDAGVTPGQEVTVNASDLTLTDDTWVFFKFATPMTGLGTATYKVGIKSSSADNALFYRDATAANWTRLLRTAATQVPVAADAFYIAGEWTAAGTVTARIVTLNETATTDYGLMDIGQNGTASAGVTASTNYNLKLSGDLTIWAGGTLSLGTAGTPVPSTSTFKLQFDCTTNVEFGITAQGQGTFIAQGATKTIKAFLASDAASSATSLTSDVSTGWKSGDEIALASTTRTRTQCEKKTMSGDATGTTIPIAALTNAHSGTTPALGELANLTRNVKVCGASASLQSYIRLRTSSVSDVDYAEFYWLGSSLGNQRGIEVEITTGVANWQYSSIHDFKASESIGIQVSQGLTTGQLNIEHNVFYDISYEFFKIVSAAANSTWVFNDNLAILNASYGCHFINHTGTITNNTVAGSNGYALFIQPGTSEVQGTVSGNTAHSNEEAGIYYATLVTSGPILVTNTTLWRNNNNGALLPGVMAFPFTWNGVTAFGNAGSNVSVTNASYYLIFNNFTLNGDTTFSTPHGIYFAGQRGPQVTLNNSSLGVAAGILTTHTTGDLYFTGSSVGGRVVGSNNKLASSVPVGVDAGTENLIIGFNKLGQVPGVNKTWVKIPNAIVFNVITADYVIFNTAAPCLRATPAATTIKFEAGIKRKTVNSGATVTFTVYVRKSVVGDAGGANYNGAEPRLMIRTNSGAGVGTGVVDVVGDTMSVVGGVWEQLTYTTGVVTEDAVIEAYVDCDGTAGWINVDDWS